MQAPQRLLRLLEGWRVTRLVLVPQALAMLADGIDALRARRVAIALADLRILNVSGDVLPAALVRRVHELLPRCRVFNLYGSSEVSGDCACFDALTAAAEEAVGQEGDISEAKAGVKVERPLSRRKSRLSRALTQSFQKSSSTA